MSPKTYEEEIVKKALYWIDIFNKEVVKNSLRIKKHTNEDV